MKPEFPVAIPEDFPEFCAMDLETVYCNKDFEDDDNPDGFRFAHKFRMSCGVTWTQTDGYKHWFENDVIDMIEYIKKYPVVTWNGKNFDYKVLSGYTDYNFDKLRSFDLLEEILKTQGYRLNLKKVCEANFGGVHGGSYTKATEWWKSGNHEKVKVYCEQDVRVTIALFLTAIQNNKIKFFRFGNPQKPDWVNTDYWEDKFFTIATGEKPKTPELLKDMEVLLSIDMRIGMRGQGEMSHDQEKAVLALLQSLQSSADQMKAMGSPIQILEIESHIKKRLGD